jgi:hypothetical protein
MPDNPADSHVLSELIDDVAELLGIEDHDEAGARSLLSSVDGGLWWLILEEGRIYMIPDEDPIDENVIYDAVMDNPVAKRAYRQVTNRIQTKIGPDNLRLSRGTFEEGLKKGVQRLTESMNSPATRTMLLKRAKTVASRTGRSMLQRLASPRSGWSRAAASTSVAAMASAAIVIALYGTVALAAVYPVEQLKYLDRQLTNMARILGRPLRLTDLEVDYSAIVVSFVAIALCSPGGRQMVTKLASGGAVRGTDGRSYPAIGTDIHAAGMRLLSQLKSVGDEALENLVLEV